MNDSTLSAEVTKPYAQALMSIAQDNAIADQLGAEATQLLEVLASSDELTQFLANPLVEAEPKKAVLRQIADGQVNPTLLNFLLLLVDRGRIVFMKETLQQYQVLLRELNQTVLADVTAAVELSDAQLDAIRERVQRLTGARGVELSVQVDPTLLGGLVVKVGSQVIDASLRGQLRRIGMQLATAA
ncbi:MAG: ATP synthase F1 subunit delta [Nodosilinea sp.]